MTIEIQSSDIGCNTRPVYKLGNVVFCVQNCDPVFEKNLGILLPSYERPVRESDRMLAIDTGCQKDVLELIRRIISIHHKRNYVWVEGSCLIAPNGQKILVAGKPRSGKSTTSIGLTLAHGWLILCENFCPIDHQKNELLKFLSPALFDERSVQILERCVSPGQTFSVEWRKNRVWSPLKDHIGETTEAAKFDLALWLDRHEESDQDRCRVTDISAGEFARKVLSTSNLLKINGSFESFIQSLGAARCMVLEGGELEQRLDVITNALSREFDQVARS